MVATANIIFFRIFILIVIVFLVIYRRNLFALKIILSALTAIEMFINMNCTFPALIVALAGGAFLFYYSQKHLYQGASGLRIFMFIFIFLLVRHIFYYIAAGVVWLFCKLFYLLISFVVWAFKFLFRIV